MILLNTSSQFTQVCVKFGWFYKENPKAPFPVEWTFWRTSMWLICLVVFTTVCLAVTRWLEGTQFAQRYFLKNAQRLATKKDN
jgi:hypothetical protein